MTSTPAPSQPLPLEDRLRSITVEPDARAWAALVRRRRSDALSAAHAEFRAQLGLPTDRPVIMSGHQAEFWHPGIFAKYAATQAAAHALRSAPVWLVVDQDANPPGTIRYAARTPGGPLTARTWRALPEAETLAEGNVPLCHIPASAPAKVPPEDSGAGAHLARIAAALREHADGGGGGRRGAASVAQQVTRALESEIRDVVPIIPTLLASSLSSTALFADLVERMRADPGACVQAYNEAVRSFPAAGMKPLVASDDPELPLWHLPGSTSAPKARRRATLRTLTEPLQGVLAPRALLMTGLLRLAGCDLFIHGLGGGVYDPITEQWLRTWLGVELAPAGVVTATLTLPLEADVLPPEAIDWAVWRAHHARHDPLLLGDRAGAARKAELLARIRAAKEAGEDPAPAFRELHTLLDSLRAGHAPALAHLDAEAQRIRAKRPEAAVLHDRTWPVPLYPRADLIALRDAIDQYFAHAIGGTP